MDSPTVGLRRRTALLTVCILALILARPVFASEEERFAGVGLQVVPTAGGELVVLQVVEGSPAAREGLKPGDFIFRVDDQALAGSDFADVVSDLLWGRTGTEVTLGYLRPGVAGEHSATLRRIPLETESEPTPGVRMITPERPVDSDGAG